MYVERVWRVGEVRLSGSLNVEEDAEARYATSHITLKSRITSIIEELTFL